MIIIIIIIILITIIFIFPCTRRLPRGSSPPLEFEIIQLDNPFPLGRPESLPRSTNSFQSPAMAADGSSVPSSAGSSVGSRVGSMGSSRIGSSVSSSKPPTGLFVGQHQSQPDSGKKTIVSVYSFLIIHAYSTQVSLGHLQF